jgi:hypothetical protein
MAREQRTASEAEIEEILELRALADDAYFAAEGWNDPTLQAPPDEITVETTLDLPGFGKSTLPEPSVSPEAIAAVVDALARRPVAAEASPSGPRRPRRGRGRGLSAVSIAEADKAAAIFMAKRKRYATHSDGGAYAVWVLYRRSAAKEGALSRRTIAHLIAAIEDKKIQWEARRRSLKIPSEFRTSAKMFVIPRRKPAS